MKTLTQAGIAARGNEKLLLRWSPSSALLDGRQHRFTDSSQATMQAIRDALETPGVHLLRDFRTNVYNFDPFLRNIAQPNEFNFDSIPKFVPPSQDTTLIAAAKRHGSKYVSSTSSISPTLSQLYFLISRLKGMNLSSRFTGTFDDEPQTFTQMSRAPIGVYIRPHQSPASGDADGSIIRSIVAEKAGVDDEKPTILMQLGNVLEKLLTHERADFERMLKGSPQPFEAKAEETYNYLAASKLLLRSQLDCHDPRLPKRAFDLKTRATLPIRMDVHNHTDYVSYRLHRMHGLYESFEREFFDLCRSVLLKYYFQVRIGDMDGILVAYHNTAELFGFQYLTLAEMDEILFGHSVAGDRIFSMILNLYEGILDTIVPLYGQDETIRLTFALSKDASKLNIFSESIPAEERANPSGSPFNQFTLTVTNFVNGMRSEELYLSPTGLDDWKMDWCLAQQKPNLADFESARRRASSGSPPASADSSTDVRFSIPIMRNARRQFPQAMTAAANDSRPEILAPWTLVQ